ncbi:uncharacterized protein LOC132623670 [Lycium barbarum]|uniref:uncharacterized protein LOC132623670 n=1 Tax=Lycium barbarum TaxID=112863 RepID=UPI00293F4D2B|nr:uncharacterized protein LOC132623670 [Lycium barbarum]
MHSCHMFLLLDTYTNSLTVSIHFFHAHYLAFSIPSSFFLTDPPSRLKYKSQRRKNLQLRNLKKKHMGPRIYQYFQFYKTSTTFINHAKGLSFSEIGRTIAQLYAQRKESHRKLISPT